MLVDTFVVKGEGYDAKNGSHMRKIEAAHQFSRHNKAL